MIVFTLTSASQNKPIPPPRGFDSLDTPAAQKKSLPTIDLPEVVIMGAENISFAASQKNMLELYRSDVFTNRSGVGLRENYKANQAPSLAQRLVQPMIGSSFDGLVKIGYGRFVSPYVEGWYSKKLEKGDFAAHVLYNRNDDVPTYPGFNRLGVDLAGGSYFASDAPPLLSRSRVQGDVHFSYNNYPHFSFLYESGKPPYTAQWLYDRSTYLIGYGATIISRNNPFIDYRAGIFVEHTRIHENFHPSFMPPDTSVSSTENLFGITISAAKELSSILFTSQLKSVFYLNTTSGEYPNSPLYTNLGGAGEYWVRDRFKLRAAINMFLFRGSSTAASFRIYPSLRTDYFITAQWNAFLNFEPDVVRNSLRRLLLTQPYINYIPSIEHENIPFKLQAGVRFDDPAFFDVLAYMEFLKADNYIQFVRSAPSAYPWVNPLERWDVEYGDNPKIFSLNIAAVKKFSVDDRIDVTFVARNSYHGYTDTQLAYLPNYQIKALYRHSFSFPLSLEANMNLVGKRYISGKTFPGFVLFGLEAEYAFAKQFAAFFQITNLINQKFKNWDGYQARPFYIMAGFAVQF